VNKKPKRFQFLMGDDQLEDLIKEMEKCKGKNTTVKIDIAPTVKNVGYISFIETNFKSKEVKKND